ncbi:MAG: hypothetical protein R6V04_05235 [bacterium]
MKINSDIMEKGRKGEKEKRRREDNTPLPLLTPRVSPQGEKSYNASPPLREDIGGCKNRNTKEKN